MCGGPPKKALNGPRSALKAAVADHSISPTDTVAKLVGQRAPSLLLDDPTLEIELALLRDFTRDDDKSRFRQMELDALPSASKVWSAETAAQRLHVVAAGDLFKFSRSPSSRESAHSSRHRCGRCRRAQARPSDNGT